MVIAQRCLLVCFVWILSLSLSLSLSLHCVVWISRHFLQRSDTKKKFWRFEDLQGQKIVSETKKERKEGRKEGRKSQGSAGTDVTVRERERKKEARILLFLLRSSLFLLAISLPLLLKVFHVFLQK
jgi:hypothetical protein